MGCSIVLVDDDQGFADVLADVLRLERHEVNTFPTPDEALEWLLAGGQADLVLLDLHTPGMSAQCFQTTLMSAMAWRDLPVVIVSGDPDLRTVAAEIGAADAVQKPVDIDRLLETIERYEAS
jgi:DNA-binding NtrC family response regulator